ncbi:hypothetical protein AB0L57_01360 [Nocardia sp. NPDC052254]|uniref:hypothetical protein n=1 Tax=Nocardia sp. NPDC052254 TaxID=3155681 RepID=UPI003422DB03
MAVLTAVVLRAGGWHPGSVVGRDYSARRWADDLVAQAELLRRAAYPPRYLGIDNVAHAHDGPNSWRLVAVDALSIARRSTDGDSRSIAVPTVTVADLDRETARDLLGTGIDLQVRVTNRHVGAGPMPSPTPPDLDLTDPEILRGMDLRFTDAARTLTGVRAAWAGASTRPRLWALAHTTIPYRLAAGSCDDVALTPRTAAQARAILAEVRAMESERHSPLRTFADVTVCLDEAAGAAADRMAELDRRAATPLRSDAAIVVGTGEQLLARCDEWLSAGFDGIRFRPCGAADVGHLAETVLPRLARR